ncbi:MAG TPA: multicopper oxidase domain-containing protein [Saprospiraceae bacterium]|nr:multicopper oxidase domain-containing protein [Saprospiraceae bacterium]
MKPNVRLSFHPDDLIRQILFSHFRGIALFFLCFGLGPTLFAQLKDPVSHPKFVNPLPNPAVINATGGGDYVMKMAPTTQWLGLVDVNNNPLITNVWGYGQGNNTPTYPGPTFVAMKDVPVQVKWENHLPDNHLLPIDMSIHVAHPHTWMGNGVPAVTHLHGGHTESASDGLPDAWFTSNYNYTGHDFIKKKYYYANDQEAATLWYHDHALGITRLNVYAGLAGFYLLRDANELSLGLPTGDYERGIVFQDRDFDADGQLTMPADGESQGDCQSGGPFNYEEPILPNEPMTPGSPSTMAEFFGTYILVNGMTWPYLDVEPRQYRLRLLNGSDSRFYFFEFKTAADGVVPFLQIGTDDGLLRNPVPLNNLLLGPGERADILIDFAVVGGNTPVTLYNYGPDEPFGGDPEGITDNDLDNDLTRPTAQLMRFNVTLPLNPNVPTTNFTPTSVLRPVIEQLNTPVSRKVVLFEGRDAYCRLRPQLGILDENSEINGSLMWDEEITENPDLNAVEYWDIYNTTADAHPMHLHLVSFQILDRTTFDGTVTFTETGDPMSGGTKQILSLNAPVTFLSGWNAPDNEKGWKDTGVIPPGGVMRVAARFDRPDKYVWHCHILSHEDHEMMRPFFVGEIPPNTISFSGRIKFSNDNNKGVKDATASLTGSATASLLTDEDGDFRIFTSVGSGSFTLKPTKTINKLNGVTSADVLSIQKHVALINPITDLYKQVAADVNKSNTITTTDATIIQQSLLGNPAALVQFKTSWRFVPTNHVMTTPPWGFPEQRTYTNINSSQTYQDFYGIKTGDVVTAYANPTNFGTSSSLVLRTQDQDLQSGTDLTVEFSADQLDDVAALQFALQFDPEQLQFIEVQPLTALPLTMDHFGLYNIADGEIRCVWSQAEGASLEEAAPAFRLKFNILQSGGKLSDALQLQDDVLPAHVYTSTLEESGVELAYSETTGTSPNVAVAGYRLLQNTPNPFAGKTTIGFVLPGACDATLRLFDMSGRLLREHAAYYAVGKHIEEFDLSSEGLSGLLYYELTTPFGVLAKKMVVVKR